MSSLCAKTTRILSIGQFGTEKHWFLLDSLQTTSEKKLQQLLVNVMGETIFREPEPEKERKLSY